LLWQKDAVVCTLFRNSPSQMINRSSDF
jgi:hypothetical protein